MMLIKTKILIAVITAFTFASHCRATNPVFIQAISSALGTIPFTGFPLTMTAGLAGAKLAVGGKLLYFLGLFGRRGQSKPPNPLPSMFSGGIGGGRPGQSGLLPMQMLLGGAGGGGDPFSRGQFPMFQQNVPPKPNFGGMPPQNGFSSPPATPQIDPAALMSALEEQGINPLQLMTALESAGMDPAQMMQTFMGGGGRSGNRVPLGGPGNRAGESRPNFPPRSNAAPAATMNGMPHDFSDSLPPDSEQLDNSKANNEDVESFFAFLNDMDDNSCISRLICDIGADPDFLGEFSRNIDTIINSLEVSPESGAYQFMEIMENGRSEGACAEKFPRCDEDAYDIVKSVAPSVGVPSGVSSEAVNRL